MATNRFNYNDKFSLKDQKVGISSNTPEESLEVASGTLKAVDLQSNSGVTTFSTYEGFLNSKTSYTGNVQIETGESGTLSGEVVIGAGLTMHVGTGATSGQGSVASVKVSNTFNPPIGGTADRPTAPKPGALFYNKDFKTIEYWDGNFWRQVDNRITSGRGLLGGGQNPGYTANVSFINISTFGNSQNFGDLTAARTARGCSSSTRALWAGGWVSPTGSNIIDYNTIASEGNSIDFGDMTHQRRNFAALSSSTRGVFSGGESPANLNVMDYVEISTIGDSVDFGDLINERKGHMGINSSVRGIWVAAQSSTAGVGDATMITIASKGNAVRFGGFDNMRSNGGSASNPVRGIYAGGYTGPAGNRTTNVHSCIIASEGNFTKFADLAVAQDCGQGMSNVTRGVFVGGTAPRYGQLSAVDFTSGGNAVDFGTDFGGALGTSGRGGNSAGCSDSHGGLGGF